MAKKWKKIDDNKVQHIWKCEEEHCSMNGIKVIVSPDWYQENGTPLCECGEDCIYQHTEIKQ